MRQDQLLQDLKEKVNKCYTTAKQFKSLPKNQLTYSTSPEKWNILQCLEHCNRYWGFYSKEFNRHLIHKDNVYEKMDFNSGFWGKKFTQIMFPKAGKLKKMRTFKSKNPSSLEVNLNSIDTYIQQQEELLVILEKAKTLNLNQHQCKLTIPFVKMNFGSTLQFIVFHNLRHLKQAQDLVR